MLNCHTSDKCSVNESIAQNIMMIITCRYGEVAGKSDFGCEIWELEFNQLIKIHEWEDIVESSILKSVSKYEKRIKNVKIKVSLKEVDDDIRSKSYSQVKRKAIINIAGNLIDRDDVFNFNTSIYVSPLSQ